MGHLDRRQADTTAGGVDQDPVARFQLCPVECEPDSQRGGRDGGCLDRAHPVGNRRQQLDRHVEPTGERALHEAVDALADLESGDTLAQLCDDAGEVAADGAGIAWIEAQNVEYVAEVDASGLNSDLHVVLVRRRHLLLGQAQVVDRAAFGGSQHVVATAWDREVTAARPRQQPRSQQLALAQGQLRFLDRGGQQAGEELHSFRRTVDVDQFAPQCGFFVDCGAPEAPQRCLDGVDRLGGFACHGVLGDNP